MGVEERGGYYDQSGALRDMVQSHTTTTSFSPYYGQTNQASQRRIRAEKIKVFKTSIIQRMKELKEHFIRGQYRSG